MKLEKESLVVKTNKIKENSENDGIFREEIDSHPFFDSFVLWIPTYVSFHCRHQQPVNITKTKTEYSLFFMITRMHTSIKLCMLSFLITMWYFSSLYVYLVVFTDYYVYGVVQDLAISICLKDRCIANYTSGYLVRSCYNQSLL